MSTRISSGVADVSFVPFLKWAGGKRWLLCAMPELLPSLRGNGGIYFEPFMGSAAVFFALKPNRAVLNDVNPDLVNLYSAIQKDPSGVARLLRKYQALHSSEFYYKVRSRTPRSMISAAARVLYLNRTCWNGLYRVNLKGQFNVPIGTKSSVLLPTDDFVEARRLLRGATIRNADFEVVVDAASAGDVIFADPPYTVNHNLNGFLKYNERLFSWDDQVRLHNAALRAVRRGARVVVTNADHESVRSLYKERCFHLTSVARFSKLSGKSSGRRSITELVISSFKI